MQTVMKIIGQIITTQPTERKVVALNVLSNIVQLDVSSCGDFQTKNVYFSIAND